MLLTPLQCLIDLGFFSSKKLIKTTSRNPTRSEEFIEVKSLYATQSRKQRAGVPQAHKLVSDGGLSEPLKLPAAKFKNWARPVLMC